MYQWDPTVLDLLTLPADVNRELFIPYLLNKVGNMETQCPDPAVFKLAVRNWSKVRLPIWEKLVETTKYEYNAIHNYDRTEERTLDIERERTEDRSGSLGRNVGVNGTDTGTINVDRHETEDIDETTTEDTTGKHTSHSTGITDDTTNGTVEEQVSAFNRSDYEPSKKTITEQTYHSEVKGDVENNDTGHSSGNRIHNRENAASDDTTRNLRRTEDTVETQHTADDIDETESQTHTEKIRAYGNIGITTTQQMIQQERDIVQFSIFDFIVDDFKMDFCLLVY